MAACLFYVRVAQSILCQGPYDSYEGFLAAFARNSLVLLDTSILQRSRKTIENHLAEDVSESLGTHPFER